MADQYMNSADQDYAAFYRSVMGPPQGVDRVTGEGLNVYKRPTVPIDPTTGLPIVQTRSGGSPPQGTKNNRGAIPAADNSLSEPWPGAYNSTMFRNNSRVDVARDIPYVAPADPTVIDVANALNINRLGLTNSPFKKQVPAERAIAEILVQGGTRPGPTGGMNRGRPAAAGNRLVYQPAVSVARAPAGDPWANLRISAGTPRPGLVTGQPNPAAVIAQALMPQRPAVNALEQLMMTHDQAFGTGRPAGTWLESSVNNGAPGHQAHTNLRGRRADGTPSWMVPDEDRD